MVTSLLSTAWTIKVGCNSHVTCFTSCFISSRRQSSPCWTSRRPTQALDRTGGVEKCGFFPSQFWLVTRLSVERFPVRWLASALIDLHLIGVGTLRWLWAEKLMSPLLPGWLWAERLKGPGPQWRNGGGELLWSGNTGPRASGTGPGCCKMGSATRRCQGTGQLIFTRWVDLLLRRTSLFPRFRCPWVAWHNARFHVVTKWLTKTTSKSSNWNATSC